MRLSVTGVSVFYMTHVQVLGDYLLLWIEPGQGRCSSKLYLIAWKQGSFTLVSIRYFSYKYVGGDDDNSSGNILLRSMDLAI
jgi:hypothetical protein